MKEDAKQDTDDQSQDGDGETNSPRSGMRPSSGMRSGFSPRGSDRRGGFSRSQNGGDFNRPQNDGDDFGPGQPPPGNDGFQPPQQPPEGMNFPPAPGGGDGGQNGNGFNPQNFPGGMPPTPPMDNTRNVRTR